MKPTSAGEARRAGHAIVLGLILGWVLARIGERDLPSGLGRVG